MIKINEMDELFIAHKELAYQKEENEKLVTELIIANQELVFLKEEKGISGNKDFFIHVLKMVQKHERI
jgi:hypothetical protein